MTFSLRNPPRECPAGTGWSAILAALGTLTVAGPLWLTGCAAPDRSAGGSSYETENAVAVRVLDPDGTPAGRVPVRVRASGWLPGDPFGSALDTWTDEAGHLSFTLPMGAWRLEALGPQGRAVADIPSGRTSTDLGTLSLAPPATVSGRAEPGSWVGAAGLQRMAQADASGWFHLDSVPAGRHVLHQIGSAARAFVALAPATRVDAGRLRIDTAGQIFLDDFEDGDSRLRHGPWTGGGWWWVDADSGVNLAPDSVSHLPVRAVFADGGGGKVFHISAAFPAEAPATTWAQCGVDFGIRPLDLSTLASVRFRARGIGQATLIVNIEGATAAEVPQASFQLDSVWRDVEIPVGSLQPPVWSGQVLNPVTRAARLRQATGLTWSLSASGDIWLDDVRLVGPSSALLWGAAPPP
jgi:hypothetical protein